MAWPTCTCGAELHALARFVDGYFERCWECRTVWFAKNGAWQLTLEGVDFNVEPGTVEVVHDVEFGTIVVVHGGDDV